MIKYYSFATFLVILLVFTLSPVLLAQDSEFNLGLDKVVEGKNLPEGWDKIGFHETSVQMDSDNGENRFVTIQSKGDSPLGVIRYFMPIENASKRITVTARVKVQGVDEPAKVSLGIAFFRDSRRIQLVSSPDITGTTDWEEVSLSAVPPNGANRFALTGALIGPGKASFDDFQVATMDGASKELNNNWTQKYPAATDDEFDAGSRIATLPTDKDSIDALDLLGRVWGFVKYHHPTIAAGKKNWDYELFRFLPKYMAENPGQRDALLVGWIKELGDFDVDDSSTTDESKLKLKPDLKWIEAIKSQQLASLLEKLQKANRSGQHYYLAFHGSVGNPIFFEESYAQFKYPDAGYRLLALYRHWNMIQYYFPYRELTDKNWNEILPDLIPRFATAKDALDYRLAAMELISSVQDTHAQFMGPDEIATKFHGTRQVPLELRFIENQFVVTDVFEINGSSDGSKIQVGDIVKSIGGTSVADWIVERGKYHWASNKPTKMRNIARSILRTNKDKLTIEFQRGETPITVTLETV